MRWSEIVRFAFAGGVNVILTFAVYVLLVVNGVSYPVANLLAWVLGIVFSYFLNLVFVFGTVGQHQGGPRQFALFGSLYILNFGICSAALIALVESGQFGPVGAQIVVIPLAVVLNYASSKFVVFRRTPR